MIIIGVCDSRPSVNEEVETQGFAQIEEATRAGTVGDFNYHKIE